MSIRFEGLQKITSDENGKDVHWCNMTQVEKDAFIHLINSLTYCVDMLLPGAAKLALSGSDIAILNDTLIEARKTLS